MGSRGVDFRQFGVQGRTLLSRYLSGEICPNVSNPATQQVYLYSDNFASVPVAGATWDVDLANGTPGSPPSLAAASNIFTASKTVTGVNVNGNAAYIAWLATYSGWDTGVCGVFVEAVHEGATGTLATYAAGLCIGLSNTANTHLRWDIRSNTLRNPTTTNLVTGIATPSVGDVYRLTLRRSTYTTQIAECFINNVLVASSTGAVQPTSATPKRVGMEFFGNNVLVAGTESFSQSWSHFKVGVI